MRKKWTFALFALCSVLPNVTALSAATVEDLVGAERARVLRTAGSIKRVELKNVTPELVPMGPLGRKYVAEIASFEPSLMVEALYLYPKPAEAGRGAWTEVERTAVYNATRALSSLAGIEYYSASRKKMRTFYETSVIVDGPEGETVLPDPVVAIPPRHAELYAIQKDLTFGENRYRYEYYAEETGFAFMQENLTSMKYGIFPILGKNRLRTTVLVLDAGDSIVMYAISAARALSVPGLENKVRNSFSNRADAIYGWFSGRADRAFKETAAKR